MTTKKHAHAAGGCASVLLSSINQIKQIEQTIMDPRFVTRTIHAYLDYPVAISLMTMPFLLELGSSHPMARWLAVVTGIAAFLLTVLTDHKFGVFRVIPYAGHLAVDFAVGIIFALAPFALGFQGIDALYYWANATAVFTVVLLNEPSGWNIANPASA